MVGLVEGREGPWSEDVCSCSQDSCQPSFPVGRSLLSEVQFALSAMSYTDVPRGGSVLLSDEELDGHCPYDYRNAE